MLGVYKPKAVAEHPFEHDTFKAAKKPPFATDTMKAVEEPPLATVRAQMGNCSVSTADGAPYDVTCEHVTEASAVASLQ